jgi:hypothetical protein
MQYQILDENGDMMRILEVDQWTSTGNITELSWSELEQQGIKAIAGGDSGAAKVLFGGHMRFMTVSPAERPVIGTVWYVCGDDGRPKLYRANYDTSG